MEFVFYFIELTERMQCNAMQNVATLKNLNYINNKYII